MPRGLRKPAAPIERRAICDSASIAYRASLDPELPNDARTPEISGVTRNFRHDASVTLPRLVGAGGARDRGVGEPNRTNMNGHDRSGMIKFSYGWLYHFDLRIGHGRPT